MAIVAAYDAPPAPAMSNNAARNPVLTECRLPAVVTCQNVVTEIRSEHAEGIRTPLLYRPRTRRRRGPLDTAYRPRPARARAAQVCRVAERARRHRAERSLRSS